MNRHLAKELRPLLLPWGIAAFAGLGHLLPLAGSGFVNHDIVSFLMGLSGVAFVVGVLVLTALPMGLELQERTLTLLVSQPMDRSRLWRVKLWTGTLAATALAIVHLVTTAFSSGISTDEIVVWAAFIVTAICSVGFYALATRSVFVGIAAAAAIPWGIILTIYLIVTYAFRIENKLTNRQEGMIAIGFFAIYSCVLLWLGRRQFRRLELRDRVQRGAQIPAILVPTRLAALNRTRPTGAIANLIRKEISLQKPIFLVSAIFVVLWVIAVALMFVRPAHQKAWGDVLDALTGIQVILMAFLTGCVALGDDKSLGTIAWHLTLPVSYRLQWAIKLLVSFGTLIAMAIALPGLLALATSPMAQVGLLATKKETALVFAAISILLFVTTFWSASGSRNAIRGALNAIITLICLGMCASLSLWMSNQYFGSSLQTPLVARLVARYHIPLQAFGDSSPLEWCYPIGLPLTLALVALIQSLALFPRLQVSRALVVRCFALLALLVTLGNFWYLDFLKARWQVASNLEAQIGLAISGLPELPAKQLAGGPWELKTTDLERGRHELSELARRWLGNGTVIVQLGKSGNTADICLPNRSPFRIQLSPYIERRVER
jgi:hypothetical protein